MSDLVKFDQSQTFSSRSEKLKQWKQQQNDTEKKPQQEKHLPPASISRQPLSNVNKRLSKSGEPHLDTLVSAGRNSSEGTFGDEGLVKSVSGTNSKVTSNIQQPNRRISTEIKVRTTMVLDSSPKSSSAGKSSITATKPALKTSNNTSSRHSIAKSSSSVTAGGNEDPRPHAATSSSNKSISSSAKLSSEKVVTISTIPSSDISDCVNHPINGNSNEEGANSKNTTYREKEKVEEEHVYEYEYDVDQLQTVLRQVVFRRLQSATMAAIEQQIVEKEILQAWKVGNYSIVDTK